MLALRQFAESTRSEILHRADVRQSVFLGTAGLFSPQVSGTSAAFRLRRLKIHPPSYRWPDSHAALPNGRSSKLNRSPEPCCRHSVAQVAPESNRARRAVQPIVRPF